MPLTFVKGRASKVNFEQQVKAEVIDLDGRIKKLESLVRNMEEADLRETLASICQMLKDEIFYTLSINTMMTALARAILAQEAQLSHAYEREWQQLAFGSPPPSIPPTHGYLEQLDALIQRLRA
jgi:hypothetical protein